VVDRIRCPETRWPSRDPTEHPVVPNLEGKNTREERSHRSWLQFAVIVVTFSGVIAFEAIRGSFRGHRKVRFGYSSERSGDGFGCITVRFGGSFGYVSGQSFGSRQMKIFNDFNVSLISASDAMRRYPPRHQTAALFGVLMPMIPIALGAAAASLAERCSIAVRLRLYRLFTKQMVAQIRQ
jgi:hypothetical protein